MDGPVPIRIEQFLTMDSTGTLRMRFESDVWDSIISVASGTPVQLGGTLALEFAADVNLVSQIGRTLRIFDWTGVACGAVHRCEPDGLGFNPVVHHGGNHFIVGDGTTRRLQ